MRFHFTEPSGAEATLAARFPDAMDVELVPIDVGLNHDHDVSRIIAILSSVRERKMVIVNCCHSTIGA